jgi:hypothetical protein
MARDEADSKIEHGNSAHRQPHPAAHQPGQPLVSRAVLTTGALIGVAALIQPELLAGMAVGAGIAVASNWLPDVAGGFIRPLVKAVFKAGYAAATMAREIVSEASESVEDILAETRAESGSTQ